MRSYLRKYQALIAQYQVGINTKEPYLIMNDRLLKYH